MPWSRYVDPRAAVTSYQVNAVDSCNQRQAPGEKRQHVGYQQSRE